MKNTMNPLLVQGEGFHVEFKEKLDSNLGKEICAFSNAKGGTILLGVTDSGTIKGINITNKLKSQITDLVRNFDPSIHINLSEVNKVLIIHVLEGKNKPYSVGGKFYLRNGPNSQQLGREEIRHFFQEESLILWDEKINKNFQLKKDFNKKAFTYFKKLANLSSPVNQNNLLKNLSIIDGRGIKNAGVILFSKNIRPFLPQATITCVLYQGTDKVEILDKKEFSGDLYSNYNDVLMYLKSKLNTRIIITSGPHLKKLELPENALREALANAIGHRNYFVSGANIQVDIYLDRVEITNPGGLVKGITKKDLGKKSLSRNMLLFGLLQRMNLVEKVGSGIKRMKKLMKDEGLEEPEFDVSENWFVIIFRRRTKGVENGVENLSEKEIKMVFLISKNPKISKVKLQEISGLSKKSIDYNIERLKKGGILKRIGSPRGGYWKTIKTSKK